MAYRQAMFVINCKNYAEISTRNSLESLLKAAGVAAAKYSVVIGIAPPQHLLGMTAEILQDSLGRDAAAKKADDMNDTGMVIPLAQHSDPKPPGSTTGYVIPELLKAAGVAGSIINHSEHRIEDAEVISDTISRLRKLGMVSILCVQDTAEVTKYAGMNPDYIAIEPPDLIGSGRAVSTERPELISDTAGALSAAAAAATTAATTTKPKLLCGAGITSGVDASVARHLGADGILVASGVVKNPKTWDEIISDLATSLTASRQE